MRRNFHENVSFELRASGFKQHLPVSDFVARSPQRLPKLFQEPNIALKKQLNIVDAVFQNRNPFHAHAEGES
jgi:hypothetical protein